ncbi:TPR domain protein, putative component of TonB system [bacterium endosymbiont of Bathymodiolus sp. 5 South]|nr:TPR domain protein, putative component of TonB system [bacterium endosymbiont of Bathymodiolus sp. 5 South]
MAQYQKAIDSYQIAVSLDQKNPITYEEIGFNNMALGQYQEAIEAYQKVIKIKPNDYMSYYNIANSYYELHYNKDNAYGTKSYNNLYESIKKAYKQAIKIKPSFEIAYINLFELSLVQNQAFEQDLLVKFQHNFANNRQAMMEFDMLSTLKKIDTTKQLLNEKQKQNFKAKYKGMHFNNWSWREIEQWINTKTSSKATLESALTFFKTFDKSNN